MTDNQNSYNGLRTMSKLVEILVGEDDKLYQDSLAERLGGMYRLTFSDSHQGVLSFARQSSPAVIILDIRLQGEESSLPLIPELLATCPSTPIIIHSGATDHRMVVEAMRLGATDYVTKGGSTAELARQVEHALFRAKRTNYSAQTPSNEQRPILIGNSSAMERLRDFIRRIKPSAGNVIITGESGVGKEVVAHYFRSGPQAQRPRPFVAVDCSTIQLSTAESLLFGHERGSFTGADRVHHGFLKKQTGEFSILTKSVI